jgi:pimeloyl-ACP methyl ester carboxylesterase
VSAARLRQRTLIAAAAIVATGLLTGATYERAMRVRARRLHGPRPGLMWSDPNDAPFDSKAVARDLHAALVAAGESAPWAMVGHSLGGPYVMAFTNLYDAEVTGLVLVDATHPDQFPRFQQATGNR